MLLSPLLGLLLSSFYSIFSCQSQGNLVTYVDPLFASRGGAGFGGWGQANRNPGAMAPFPMLRLGPDTTRVDPILKEAWSHLNRKAGYFGSDNAIRAFSHTHVQGAGDADYGLVGVMPARHNASGLGALFAQKPIDLFGELTLDRSPFNQPVVLGRPAEDARPGYYAVTLDAIATRAELAASGTHAGAHRYTCASGVSPGGGGAPASGPCALVIDVCHRTHSQQCGAASEVQLRQAPSNASSMWVVSGLHEDRGEFVRFNYSGVNVWFYMQISASAAGSASLPPLETGLWSGYAPASSGPGNATVGADLDSLGAFLVWPAPSGDGAAAAVTIEVRVGLSTVSAAAAAANLQAEQSDGGGGGGLLAFDDITVAINATWATLLGAVSITPTGDASTTTDSAVLDEGLAAARADLGLFFANEAKGNSGDAAAAAAAAAAADMSATSVSAAIEAVAAEVDAAAMAALEAFFQTSEGTALALSLGWAQLPEALLLDIAEARGRGGAALLSLKTPRTLQVDVARAARELRAATEAERAATASFRATDPLGTDLAVFATMLYLSFCAPSTYSDADGAYLGFDGAVHGATVPGGAFLSDLSLWDTHRSQAPWLALAAPRALADTAGSLLDMTAQGSEGMPRWPFANLYTEDMVGRHGTELLTDCVLTSGACAGRVALADAAEAVIAAVLMQDAAIPSYTSPGGYVPWPNGTASYTLEYAYDDYAASRLAEAAGNASMAALLLQRAQAWRNVFDPHVPALAPRLANGSFVEDAGLWTPHPGNIYYTEGSAAQWMWSVPFNLSALAAAFPGGAGPVGGPGNSFAAQLQVVLANQTFWFIGTFLPNPYCWLGNEPSMLLPWSHAFSGPEDSWRVAFWTRWHLREYYTPSSDSIPGNDDYGTLSAWGVWAYLGLYPIAATGEFILGSPVFAEARVAVPAGYGPYSGAPTPSLHIIAHNASASAIYVSGARVNGVALEAPMVSWQQLFGGSAPGAEALLEFDMATVPSPWASR